MGRTAGVAMPVPPAPVPGTPVPGTPAPGMPAPGAPAPGAASGIGVRVGVSAVVLPVLPVLLLVSSQPVNAKLPIPSSAAKASFGIVFILILLVWWPQRSAR